MNAASKPFHERTKIQLNHLKTMNRRRTAVQQRWQDFFRMVGKKIKELKIAEAELEKRGKTTELKLAQS